MKEGFTLIELLVVVLIIGILSSIALPQYTKAVEKARVAEAKIVLKSIVDATTRYGLENDTCTTNLADLDITVPVSNYFTYYIDECATVAGASNQGDAVAVAAARVGKDYEVFLYGPHYDTSEDEKGIFRCSGSETVCKAAGAIEDGDYLVF